MTKAPTAIICLSPYSGGMEIDSIKMAHKISPYAETILIAKEGHFIAKEVVKQSTPFTLETITFKSNLGPALIFGLRHLVQKYTIKNVIFFGASELKSMYFSFLGLDINLIIRHGTTKSRPKKDWFHRLIYSRVNYHIALCEHLAKNVRHIIPLGPHTQLKTIYSSLKENSTPPKEKTADSKLKLLHIGRIAEGKGQEDAISACEVLADHHIDFTLTLLGGFHEAYEEKFLKQLKQCSYKERIVLAGHSDRVYEYIEKSDIFLFPSHGEGLSNAFLEALSRNLVCISYDNTSFPELRELGFYFHLVTDRDINALRSTLLDVCRDLQNEQEKSEQNAILARSIFSLEKEMTSYLEILV